MLSGDLDTTGLERSSHSERYSDVSVRLLIAERPFHIESLQYLVSTSKRTVEQCLLSREGNLSRTKLGHKRNHHPRQQSRLAHMKLRKLIKTAQACGYSLDSEHIALCCYLRAESFSHTDSRFIVSAWSITFKMRRSVGKSSGNDGTLGKTLRHRHSYRREFTFPANETVATIHGLVHVSDSPLSRSCSLLFRQSGICVWSAMNQAVKSGPAAFLSHAESNKTAVRQGPDPFISGSLLLAAPSVQGHHLLHIRLRMSICYNLHHVRTMVHAFLHYGLQGLQ